MLKLFPLRTMHTAENLGLRRRVHERKSMHHDQFGVKVLCELSGIPAGSANTGGKISGKYN